MKLLAAIGVLSVAVALPFVRQEPCVVEAEAKARATGEAFAIPEPLAGSARQEWRASVAIYKPMR